MERLHHNIKTSCLYIIWEKQDNFGKKIFYIPKNMHTRTMMMKSATINLLLGLLHHSETKFFEDILHPIDFIRCLQWIGTASEETMLQHK